MLVMRCLAVAIVLSLLSGWSCAQAPGDEESFCTETLPSFGVNILDYPPEVKPLMDSRHYRTLLPPNTGAVWQTVDNDNNNPNHLNTDWLQASSSSCRVTLAVCGFPAGIQDNWIITQHISRMVNGTALQQVTVQVDFIMNSCDILNNCRRSFAIQKYETSTINTTVARNLSNYERVGRIVPRDGSGSVRENGSVNINFVTDSEATGFYLGIQDETSCLVIHRVLVFYYVCPAVTSDLITRPETIAPIIGGTAPPVQVVAQCVENASPVSGTGPRFVCSQNGVWSLNIGTGCVCGSRFQSSSNNRSCVGCDPGMYLATNDTCLPCPANSNSTQSGLSECPCFEGYYRAAGEPPEMECTTCDAGTYGTGGTCLLCPANSNSTQSGAFMCPCFEGYYRAAEDTPEMECTLNITAPRLLQVHFINGSPVVEGNTVRVDIMATVPGASFMCELLRRNSPPVMSDCSNGTTTFTGLAPGVYRLRIVASASGYNRPVIRRRVVIPRDSNYCTANLIDEGVFVSGSNLTVHFQGVGPVTGFQCIVDRRMRFSCTSPVSVTGLSQGRHHFKVLPQGCDRGNFRALPFKFTIQ